MNEPQLFVICNNCGSEVSPYVTECPYCGKRLRKRAPDLPKSGGDKSREKDRVRRQLGFRGKPKARKQARSFVLKPRRAARAPRRRLSFETERPRATIALVLASVLVSIATRVNGFPTLDLVAFEPLENRWWSLVTSPFIHFSFGYGFIALVAVMVFGYGLESRFGPWRVAALWLIAGAAGVAAELALPSLDETAGANAIALAFLVAWVWVQQSEDEQYDRLGVLAIAAAVLALPLVSSFAGIGAATAGMITGLLAGMLLARR